MRKFLTWSSLVTVATMAVAGSAPAATLTDETNSLIGEWEGQTSDGSMVHLSFTAGQEPVLLNGRWQVGGGNFARDTGLSLVRLGGNMFLVPDNSPFTAAQPVYNVTRLPSGGLRGVQLQHDATEGGMALRVEEVRFGKQRDDGTRVLHFGLGDKLCADAASPSGKACGSAEVQDVVLHKLAQ
ncbi:MAG: hypothetical protein FJ146_19645 [Deltaproteobacteria bacterium]|nr:hypothetical protein [Deltaproteobacteria bacterium]